MHVNDPAPGDAKVYEFDEEEHKKAQAAVLVLEKDVKLKSAEIVKPIHPVSLVKLGIGHGRIVIFFVIFPFLVSGLRKVVQQVREWRKPRFY